MDRAEKQNLVGELKEDFSSSESVVVVHYHGLNVQEVTELRNKARESGARVKVAKNTLAKMAANDAERSDIVDLFSGPIALVFSEDAVSGPKVVADFVEDNEKLTIVGGAFGSKILDESGVKALAKTPSIEESRAKIVGLLSTPASQLVSLFKAPGGQVARAISAHAEQG